MPVFPPKIHPDIYDFIHPKRFIDAHTGKVVLVTGAAGGIAQEIAKHFAMAGATLALTDIMIGHLQKTVELCQQEGAKAVAFECNLSKPDQVGKLVEDVIHIVGDIDILINAAGVCNSKPIFFENFSSIWQDIEINLGGVLATTIAVLPKMKARGHGCIINIASRAGTVTVPYLASYSIGKAAVIKGTEAIQKDLDADGLGDKIQLYCCHPGAVQTNLSRRPMDPEVAEAYPALAANRPQWVKNFRTSIDLCAAVCVFIATGKVKGSLKGRYIDCEHDMEAFVDPGAEMEIASKDLHVLKVDFLGGLPNDGGSSSNIFSFN